MPSSIFAGKMIEIPALEHWHLPALAEPPSQTEYRKAEADANGAVRLAIWETARRVDEVDTLVSWARKTQTEVWSVFHYFICTIFDPEDPDPVHRRSPDNFKSLYEFTDLYYMTLAKISALYEDLKVRGAHGFLRPETIIAGGQIRTAQDIADFLIIAWNLLIRPGLVCAIDRAVRIENLIQFKVKHNLTIFMKNKKFRNSYTPEMALDSVRKNILKALNWEGELTSPSIPGLISLRISWPAVVGWIVGRHQEEIDIFLATARSVEQEFQVKLGIYPGQNSDNGEQPRHRNLADIRRTTDQQATTVADLSTHAKKAAAHNEARRDVFLDHAASAAEAEAEASAAAAARQQHDEHEALALMTEQLKISAEASGSHRHTRAHVHRQRAALFLEGRLEPLADTTMAYSAAFPNCFCDDHCACAYWCRKQPSQKCACRAPGVGNRHSGVSLVGSLASQSSELTAEPAESLWEFRPKELAESFLKPVDGVI